MGTTLEGVQFIQSCWKYMICAENGDSSHGLLIPSGIFFTQDLLCILPYPLVFFFFLSYSIVDDSGMEMINRAILGSGADWSMASTRPAADVIPTIPVTYQDSIDAGENPVKLFKGKQGNPQWKKLTTSSFTKDHYSHHGSEGALCFVPICSGHG